MDYNTLAMSFIHNNTSVVLQGLSSPTPMGLHQLQRLVQYEPEARLFSLTISDPYTTSFSEQYPAQQSLDQLFPNFSSLSPEFAALLANYIHIFQEPITLPPPRQTDHHIPLNPNAVPVNVRPYRCPHSQKL